MLRVIATSRINFIGIRSIRMASTIAQTLRDAISATPVVSSLEGLPGGVICTHSGSFHCDEALACAMLKVLPAFRPSPIVRTRNTKIFPMCTLLVDVGAVYDPSKLLFDHHQASFTDTYDAEHSIRLSSAGIIYKHYGRDIVTAIVNSVPGADVDDKTIDKLVLRVYDHFIMELDAIDNGVDMCKEKPLYKVSTGLSSRVGRLNPAWNEEITEEETNARFREAMQLAGSEFLQCILGYVTSWLPARDIVKRAYDNAKSIHPSGSILVLDRFCPWKDHLFELEAEAKARGETPNPLYVIFQDVSKSWRVQTVPMDDSSFANRKSLPAEWAGLRDEELSAKSGIPNCVFVHASRFIGGNTTYEGALQMAVAAVEAE